MRDKQPFSAQCACHALLILLHDQHLVPSEHLAQGQHFAHQVSDAWLVAFLHLHAGLPQGEKLLGQHSQELAITHSVSEHDESVWLLPVILLVELIEKRLSPHLGWRMSY